MNIGYACITLGLPGVEMKNCIMKNADEERLMSLIGHNLDSLSSIIDYNIQNDIGMFRMSSDLIPFGSSLAKELDWENVYSETLSEIKNKIKNAGMRVSMHPGQYTVLNSPTELVVERAINDLDYHTKVMDCLELGAEHKIIIHLGGAYGDKEQAKKRFVLRYNELSSAVKSRLVLENDDKLFNIEDVLETAFLTGMPVVYDNLHNALNPADKFYKDIEWVNKCAATWTKKDGPQKVHYSQQHPDKKPGSHSETIAIDTFLEFYQQLTGMNIDIMLEVKDKNLSAIKCINCVTNKGINKLETEWAHYKYFILERSPEHYNAIRKLLKDKSTYPALEMYRMIEMSLRTPITNSNAINTAQHVWGYLKDKASEAERKRFQNALQRLECGEGEVQSIKNILFAMARKYKENYLLNSYYFYL